MEADGVASATMVELTEELDVAGVENVLVGGRETGNAAQREDQVFMLARLAAAPREARGLVGDDLGGGGGGSSDRRLRIFCGSWRRWSRCPWRFRYRGRCGFFGGLFRHTIMIVRRV